MRRPIRFAALFAAAGMAFSACANRASPSPGATHPRHHGRPGDRAPAPAAPGRRTPSALNFGCGERPGSAFERRHRARPPTGGSMTWAFYEPATLNPMLLTEAIGGETSQLISRGLADLDQ